MQFHRFHSIENGYRQKFINQIKTYPCGQQQWCVMEKVHGANFSFTTDGKTVIPGKRTSFLNEEEQKAFYRCHVLVKEISDKFLEIRKLITEDDVNYITVYGELFGGGYEGYNSYFPLIQKGVQYSPDHKFMAYDIRLILSNGRSKFMDYHEAVEIFKKVGLFYAHCLFEGSLDDCIAWSAQHNSDQTTIPKFFNLDDIKDNIREGHVIKPIISARTEHGDVICLKDKNDRFKEKSSVKKHTEIDDQTQKMIDEAVSYVTEQRWDNLVSKNGPLTDKAVGKYIKELISDSLKDFNLDGSYTGKEDWQNVVKKRVQQACHRLVMSKL